MSAQAEREIIAVHIDAPIESVWQALCEPAKILQWFGWDAATLADEVQFIFGDHSHPDANTHVLAFDPWEGSADRFALTPSGAGTLVKVIRSGPMTNGYDEMIEGWRAFTSQLKVLLERKGSVVRRTLYLSGRLASDGPLPRAALGLNSTTLAPGDAKGALQASAEYQSAVAMPAWGNGLLIITDQPANGDIPGRGWAILTTYGLTDTAFADIKARWSNWWQANYPLEFTVTHS